MVLGQKNNPNKKFSLFWDFIYYLLIIAVGFGVFIGLYIFLKNKGADFEGFSGIIWTLFLVLTSGILGGLAGVGILILNAYISNFKDRLKKRKPS